MKKKIGIFVGIFVLLVGMGSFALWVMSPKAPGKTSQIGNEPILLEGMTAIGFEEGKEEPKVLKKEEQKEGIWYEYDAQEENTSKWANARTKDGSMWVWIPRFAYKIDWNKETKTGKIEVVFLQGTTHYDKEGKDVTKQGYIVHPAFQNGTKHSFQNGEWDKEISGFWVAKFEAGFAEQKNTASEEIKAVETDLVYEGNGRNVWGEIIGGQTKITYPVFVGKTYSYNNITINDIYRLTKALTSENNPYGLASTSDSHLMKNSEWGACAYLAHSQYGRKAKEVTINNLEVSKVARGAETVTGYAGSIENARMYSLENLEEMLQDSYEGKTYAWYTKKGGLASTTGNAYGVFDLSGGASEYTAGYIKNISEHSAQTYGKSIVEENPKSTKYCTVYQSEQDGETIGKNYEKNQKIYGDAIVETSQRGSGYTSWFGETSMYVKTESGFFIRGGDYNRGTYAGLFDFNNHSGHSFGSYSFRPVII